VMRFCQSFMTELYRHMGPNEDVPAGDIGVSAREIGYLFGQYKRLTGRFEGALTGKGSTWGGSLLRPEATGYGLVFFAVEALHKLKGQGLRGRTCCVSGAGNVAIYAVEQLIKQGAVVLTMSDSDGFIHEPDGLTEEGLAHVKRIKQKERARLSDYVKSSKTAKYAAKSKPWGNVECELAFPCATQNELAEDDARALIDSGKLVALFEGANMPCTSEAIRALKRAGVLFAPGKASNAGGVAVSGLEMAQNSMRVTWTRDEVEEKLRDIMRSVLDKCDAAANEFGRPGDLQAGANLAGFTVVAGAMLDQGAV